MMSTEAASTPSIPPRAYQDPLETWSEKFVRKFNENPWVPLGCLATCGALVMSAVKLRAGKSKDMNYWLRARVVLQGATVLALLSGTMSLQKAREARLAAEAAGDLSEPELSKEKQAEKEKERFEFEERLKQAELATEVEAGFGVAGTRRVKTSDMKRGGGVSVGSDPAQHPPAPNATSNELKSSGKWRWWSNGSGPGSGSQDSENA
ncbi:hypothetical protein NLJ89_g9717 [Agrocybe chaxingu]|uniref:HIG1 domain-containing protein n=1 Tax=Agrocybe chaxingu TaxID=84603 RepID=A0A9W8MPL1_9AGAR|nr:hypothetical protein NLJ89_g9717 [Agrocybe chaxingu]